MFKTMSNSGLGNAKARDEIERVTVSDADVANACWKRKAFIARGAEKR